MVNGLNVPYPNDNQFEKMAGKLLHGEEPIHHSNDIVEYIRKNYK